MASALDILFLVALCGEVALLVYLDRVILRSWLTPTFVLAVPYTVVVLLAWIFAKRLDFYPFYVSSVAVWMVGLALFWFVGVILSLFFARAIEKRSRAGERLNFERSARKFALVILWMAYPLLLFRVASLLGSFGGLQGLGSTDFARAYGRGLFAHLTVLTYPLLILLMGTVTRRQYLVIGTIVVGLGLLLVYQVKSWVIVPIIAALFYRWSSGRLKISFRVGISFALLMVALFFATYLVGFGARDPSTLTNPAVYLFLARHAANYLFAGVMSLSQTMQYGLKFDLSPAQIFAPIVNVYQMLSGGELVSAINPNFLSTGYLGQTSNVNTLFGTLVLMLGNVGAVLYVAGMALIIHVIYLTARLSRNCWFGVVWCFVAGMLAIGWFEFYFHSLASLEASLFCAGLGIAFMRQPKVPSPSPETPGVETEVKQTIAPSGRNA